MVYGKVMRMPDQPPIKQFQFIGGDLSLDFCNTVGGKREGIPRENLHSCAHFLAWCRQAGILTEAHEAALLHQARGSAAKAAQILTRAIRLRESIYKLCTAVIRGQKPPTDALEELNAELSAALGRLRLEVTNESRFDWRWEHKLLRLDHALAPIARAAAELLTNSQKLPRLCQCQGENCGWLFLDSSKNRSRCWCDMRDCGNRAKVRRHRSKKRP